MRFAGQRKPDRGKDIEMNTLITSRDENSGRHPPNPQNTSISRTEVTQFMADIDGVLVLVRFIVGDIRSEMQSRSVIGHAGLHSLLSRTVEKMVDGIGGSPSRDTDHPKPPLATVELISIPEHLAPVAARSNDTMLRVGPLELDLLDRTAKRGDRRIDLRPREFQLLKYMMKRSGRLLTRAAILKDVWNYKLVPDTNLVDVHMGKLRRKVDGSNEFPLIRNVRGVGFVLSALAFSHFSAPRPAGRMEAWPPDSPSRRVENPQQY
jgi:DNA-binding winged helix-turn-helix (wHTH) protein